MNRIAIALVALLCLASVSEAGLFRKRDGSKRTPVRSTLRAAGGVFHCSAGSCGK